MIFAASLIGRFAPLLIGGAMSSIGIIGNMISDYHDRKEKTEAVEVAVRDQLLTASATRRQNIDDLLLFIREDLTTIEKDYNGELIKLRRKLDQALLLSSEMPVSNLSDEQERPICEPGCIPKR